MLLLGDPVPPFRCASSVNPDFNFDTVAGRYVVLTFFGSTKLDRSRQFLAEIARSGATFDVTNVFFAGVTTDPDDVARLNQSEGGRVYFHDLDRKVSRLFGLDREGEPYATRTYVLDQSLRVIGVVALNDDVPRQIETLLSILGRLPRLNDLQGQAPVLVVPYVLEPDLCAALIDYYQTQGGHDSGFMRDVNGKTVGLTDYNHKRRMDCEINDKSLVRVLHNRLQRRVIPAIRQAYQFNVTRIERHIVACYDAEQNAHFKAHRDNTTLGTAHRRFAVTINLNSPDYEGGEIWFPEFGPRRYKAPSGAAIVFSCSLLHEVPRVTKGKRYAFLPFLYDDAAAAVRERNRQHLGDLTGATGAPLTTADCGGAKPAEMPRPTLPVLDGRCGCGNPDGCGTCLSAAAYSIGASPTRN
jgi:predicted 2-oxoglutarate/Fe(II)-dependent dioxygenase YbiX/alkyl hydroperoxide reductase subunit AhpC